MTSGTGQDERDSLVRRHLAFGWTALSLVVAFGLGLEAMHALKAPIYLNVDHATTRLMWRLAHAHLGVLALTSIAFAFTISRISGSWQTTSRWLVLGTVLLPLGFLLGGLGAHAGDPGLGIVLVPPGALGVGIACVRTAMQVWRAPNTRG